MGPIFVVGCCRSGTTLVQSVLAQTPGYISFPETNILYHALEDLDYRRFGRLMSPRRVVRAMRGRLRNQIGITRNNVRPNFLQFLNNTGHEELQHLVPEDTYKMSDIFYSFRLILDVMAGRSIWIEKTPQNIFCISYIQKYIKDARFVHVIRNGPDTIASLVDAGSKYGDFSDRFGGEDAVEKAIAQWNSAVRISHRLRGKKNHVFIRYEDVVADPGAAFGVISHAMSMPISDSQFFYNTEGLIYDSEIWKKNQSESIKKSEDKFSKIFSLDEREYILKNTLDVRKYFPLIVNRL